MDVCLMTNDSVWGAKSINVIFGKTNGKVKSWRVIVEQVFAFECGCFFFFAKEPSLSNNNLESNTSNNEKENYT